MIIILIDIISIIIPSAVDYYEFKFMNLNANLWKITTINKNQNITREGKA